MSQVKAKKFQVGNNPTASNNFTIYQPDTPDGTIRIKNDGEITDLLSLAATGLGVTGSLMVDSREVAESGSNSNGNYVRFYDGTQIAIAVKSVSGDMTTAQGSLYRFASPSITMLWPIEFISIPTKVSFVSNSISYLILANSSVSPTTTDVTMIPLISASTTGVSGPIYSTGIGRWY